jgi:hypothetical protein
MGKLIVTEFVTLDGVAARDRYSTTRAICSGSRVQTRCPRASGERVTEPAFGGRRSALS